MKKTLFFIVAALAFIPLRSQITITSVNMPVVGDTGRCSIASLASVGDYTATGANYNWDFSTLDSTGQLMRKFVPSSNTPYTFYFIGKYGEKTLDSVPIPAIPIGTMSLTMKNLYSFYKKNGTSSFNAEGLGITIAGIPVGASPVSSNDDELYFFPLDYSDRDSSTFSFSTPSFSAIPFGYKKHGYRITEVDGWGTITTPFGTEACLRVVTTQYAIDSIIVNALPAPFNRIGFPNYTRSYQWLTLTEKIPYLEITGNVSFGAFVPTQARYRDKLRSFVGIRESSSPIAFSVFPNPANQQLTIIIPENVGQVMAEIVDLQGKIVTRRELNNNTNIMNQHSLDVSDFAKGMYILNLSNSKGKESLKISIQ